ncbi:UV DNA damage repair endonuclease UvsE [Dankookia rubra]|uniref:UV DNA damage repair endonuclease UvsE n=1 Tax=Dankookia rubra TaxID=1442381 RepID=A0A4R5Q6J8_9PROT|nr:UV DNA damage repair endonuclease UvsE [Dankookia rubra]TDH58484.1 UV DNA damage repair endonuclease UvsE [Dankookia rubra]
MSARRRLASPATAARPLRLGFPVKLMGDAGIKSNDTRRWQQSPHLKVSLEHMDRALDYLDRHDIRMYRMSSDLAPYATHPDMPQFHSMVRDSDAELRALGTKAKALDTRLSFHPSQFVVLNSPDPALVEKSIWDLSSQAEMLDRMELGPEAVMVIHVGGTYGDREAANARWVETWKNKLPEHVRRRLVLEHDDLRFSVSDILWIHERTGVRLIFDHQHFWCLNPAGLDMRDALGKVLRTWPEGQRPKVHFSSPRTEMREIKRKEKGTRKLKTVLVAPVNTGHADFCNPFEFITFMRIAEGLDFDVMLEAKVKDLALIRLRPDLLRYAPDVARRFGLEAFEAPALETEEQEFLAGEESDEVAGHSER